jgi:iron complex outermembrane receptor protein
MNAVARSRAVLLTGVATILVAGPAMAQETAPAAEDMIVVTGVRASLESATAQKRDADQVVDVVTAEDIGRFPTENVADASQRITGVQITRTRGNGAQASIRGLPTAFTRVQLNGSTLTNALFDLQGGGAGGTVDRSFDFRALPTDFVRTLEVTKSPTADQQEGGLSGTINVETVRPLDLGRTTVTGSAFGVYNTNYGEVTPRLSALASTTLLDGRLGLLITGSYDRNKTETHGNGFDLINVFTERAPTGAIPEGFDYNGDGDFTDVVNVPGQIRTEIFDEDRERVNLAGVIEYEASDDLRLYVDGMYGRFNLTVDNYQNLHIFTNARRGSYDPNFTETTNVEGVAPTQLIFGHETVTALAQGQVDVRGLNRQNRSIAHTYYGKTGAEFESDLWHADVSASYSKSDMVGDNLGLAQIAFFDTAFSCPPGEQMCGIAFPAATQNIYLDPTQAALASLNGAWGRQIDDEIMEFSANLSREFDDSIIRRISVGAVASWRNIYADATSITVSGAQLNTLLDLPAGPRPGTFGGGPYEMIVGARKGEFLGGYSGSLTFPTQWVSSDTGALLADLTRAQLEGVGTNVLTPNLTSIIDLQEDIMAGYVRADFGDADELVSGNFGLRVVRTETLSRGFGPDFTGIVVNAESGGTVTVPAADTIEAPNSYTEFLPSFNLKLNMSDEFVMRFAASRTMARPNLADITPSTTITGAGNNFTIRAGNPYLEPFISLNFDASAEWYPNRDTTLTMALFMKDISTLVRPQSATVFKDITFFFASTGVRELRSQAMQETIPTNQEGVTLKGLEVGYQQFFTGLPGPLAHTGLQANYTFISNSDPQVLTAASKHNFNIGAFYENHGLAIRGSYTWRDKFVTQGLPDGNFGLGLTANVRSNLDLSISYDVTDFLTLSIQGTNVLDNADSDYTTLGNIPHRYSESGAQYLAGARVRF